MIVNDLFESGYAGNTERAVARNMQQAPEQGMEEGYRVVPGFDKEKYQERQGLEGPFHTKSGKVVYYDKVEGKYYDPDTDMYIEYDDWQAMNEQGVDEASRRDVLRGVGAAALGAAGVSASAKGGGGGGRASSSSSHGSSGARASTAPHSSFRPGTPFVPHGTAGSARGDGSVANDADKAEYVKFLSSYADAIRAGKMTPEMRKWLTSHPEVIEDLKRGKYGLTMGQLNADLVDLEQRKNPHLMREEGVAEGMSRDEYNQIQYAIDNFKDEYGEDPTGPDIFDIADSIGVEPDAVINVLYGRVVPDQGVAEGSLEEVDRRGFLKGLVGAGTALAAGSAAAKGAKVITPHYDKREKEQEKARPEQPGNYQQIPKPKPRDSYNSIPKEGVAEGSPQVAHKMALEKLQKALKNPNVPAEKKAEIAKQIEYQRSQLKQGVAEGDKKPAVAKSPLKILNKSLAPKGIAESVNTMIKRAASRNDLKQIRNFVTENIKDTAAQRQIMEHATKVVAVRRRKNAARAAK